MADISVLLQFLFSGITMGSISALIAVSLVIVYNVSRVLCFAQGEFFVYGALTMIGLTSAGVPMPIGFLLTLLIVGGLGMGIERLLIRPIHDASVGTLITMTVAISLCLRGLGLLVAGREAHPLPPFTKGEALSVLGAFLPIQVIWIALAVVVALIGIWLFFEKSIYGLSLRACAENRLGASLVGISTWKATVFAWAWGAALGALAGMVIAPLIYVQYVSGTMPMLKGFTAMAIGGLTTFGSVIAGLLLGVLEAYTIGLVSSEFADAIVFTILILVLLARSYGILGSAEDGGM
ncbi:MAG: branched-chain amino acid ABC transporter permease [Desulfobacterales bacterium]|nr:branched-chain amino acid ABC transporter permease [Desulfobacterales bacterium]